jgi:hypothetical protein
MPKKEQSEEQLPPAATTKPQGSIETILVINVLLALLEQLIPKIQGWVSQGNVTVEEQEAIRARYKKLTENMDTEFGGDHWRVRPN